MTDAATYVDSDHTSSALMACATRIAEALPGTWSAKDGGYPHSCQIVDERGRAFYVNDGRDRGRLSINGRYPNVGTSAMCYAAQIRRNGELPRITVSAEKPAKTIAADIARRFLKDFIELHDQCTARKASDEASQAKRLANAQRLAQAVGTVPGGTEKTHVSIMSRSPALGYFDADISDDSARIDVRSVSIDVAEAIMRIIAGKVAPEVIALINQGDK
jgi:hypothetical protein